MATKQSVQITQKLPSISAGGFECVPMVGDYTIVAGIVINDVIEMGILPAGYVPCDAKFLCEDLDSGGPTITLDCGIMSGTPGDAVSVRTCGNEAFAASTVGQAGGVQLDNKAAFGLLAPSTVDRSFGIKIAAAATTPVVGAKMRLTVMMRPALNGV